jgi:hypothetical protein
VSYQFMCTCLGEGGEEKSLEIILSPQSKNGSISTFKGKEEMEGLEEDNEGASDENV